MILQINPNINTQEQVQLNDEIKELGFSINEIKTRNHLYYICLGKEKGDIRKLGQLNNVLDVHRVDDQYKLVSKSWKTSNTEIDLGDGVKISESDLSIIAGPCSIEGDKQIESTVRHLKENNIKMMRGGVFKPRSSPYSFRGHGMEALKDFYSACQKEGIKVVTEVMEIDQIDPMLPYVDVLQVGARNSQNFSLLDALGKTDKAILLKRGLSGTIEELLQSAEYIFSKGNEQIILCERGIRTYEKAYRNTLDLNAIPILKEKTHLPVIVDPSHGIGIRRHVAQMALASVMSGADGIIMEVHESPENAYSDGFQNLDYDEASELYKKLRQAFDLRKTF